MFKKSLLVLLSVLVLSGICLAQDEPAEEPMEDTTAVAEPELALAEIQICEAVENKEPVGTGTVFSDDLDKIYCFTKIAGAEDTTYVNHIWYFGDEEIVRVNLPVKSSSWRTWSSKTLNMGSGKGHVEIVSEGGDVLGKVNFVIKEAKEAKEEAKEQAKEAKEKAKEKAKEVKEECKEEAKGAKEAGEIEGVEETEAEE